MRSADSVKLQNAIVDRCQPREFAAPWGFLPAHPDVLALPFDRRRLIFELAAHFSSEILIESSVATADAGGQLHPAGPIAQADELVVVQRARATGEILCLANTQGYLAGGDHPVFHALADEPLRLTPEADECHVLLAFTPDDVAVLKACGMPATLATSVEKLRPADVDRFCHLFRVERARSPRLSYSKNAPRRITKKDKSELEINLVLLGWSPAAMDLSPATSFLEAVDGLRRFERYLGLDLDEFNVWSPSIADLERLRFFQDHSDVEGIKDALLDSLDAHQVTMGSYGVPTRERPADFPAAMLALGTATRDPADIDSKARFQKDVRLVEQYLLEQVIVPMVQESMKASEMPDKALGLAAAQLVQTFVLNSIAINARLSRLLHEYSDADLDAIPTGVIDQQLAIADRLIRFGRHLDTPQLTNMTAFPLEKQVQQLLPALPKAP